MKITSLAELIERLLDVQADLDAPDLDWAVEHLEDILDDCRDYADIDNARERERSA